MSAYSSLNSLFLLTFFITSLRTIAQLTDPTYVGHVCTNRVSTNTSDNSNVGSLLISLSSNTSFFSNGSNILTEGQHNDKIFGLFLCRGDLSPEVCGKCVAYACKAALKRCPGGKEFLIQYDECMLGYSDRNIFMDISATPNIITWNPQTVSRDQSDRFNDAVFALMKKSAEEAANSKTKKFSVNKLIFSSIQTIYASVQCIPVLNSEDCLICLQQSIQKKIFDRVGGRIVVPSCNSRYEIYPFYNENVEGTVLPPPVSAPPLLPGKHKISTVIVVAIVVSVAACILLVAIFCVRLIKRAKKTYGTASADDERGDITTAGSLQFDFKVIEVATDKFSISNKLSQGGFGQVYKGTLPNGSEVAIKRLSKTSGQGEKEFKNEVVVVAKLQHRNLVKLLGYCLEREEKILGYEFEFNKSLDYFLFDSNMQSHLDWSRRYKIIGGIARGILYLHQDSRLTIIHRDLKAGNILLDADMNPKVADFGSARIFEINQTEANTRIVVGTYGSNIADVQNTHKVFGAFLCRGDLTPKGCRNCVDFASTAALKECPGGKEFLIQYDECMLGYSDRNIFMDAAAKPTIITWDSQIVARNQSDRFNKEVSALMLLSAHEAAYSETKKFAVKKTIFSSSRTIYASVQCNRVLNSEACLSCLEKSIKELTFDRVGGRILVPSCNSRYAIYPFYNENVEETVLPPLVFAPPPPVPAPPLLPGKGHISRVVILAIVVPVAICVLLFLAIFIVRVIKRAKKTYGTKSVDDERDDITTAGSLQFDFKVIEAATDKFSIRNKLGQGGFGQVYKGTLPNGLQVAIKRLSKTSEQGEKEFKNEVVVVAKLQHRNLVKLLGFCLEREEKILVYEFVPNKSLDHFLYDSNMRSQLNWSRRYKIIGGIARGILYLHQDSRLTIIHRDLKAANILLDADMNPKVADFGMARIFEIGQTEANTRKIVGTYGYMSPEYAMYGQFSMKSDVYSFGVLVLEIISGRKNSSLYTMDGSLGNLVTYTWRLWTNGSPLELVDLSFHENYERNEIVRCIHIALLCVQEDAEDRPTMSVIVQMLTTTSIALAVPRPPGHFFRSKHEQAGPSTDKSALCSIDEASITTVAPR